MFTMSCWTLACVAKDETSGQDDSLPSQLRETPEYYSESLLLCKTDPEDFCSFIIVIEISLIDQINLKIRTYY